MYPIDKIALIITVTTAVILLSVTLSPMVTGRPISEDKARIVGNLVSSFIAILSMYVGSRLKPRGEDPAEVPTQS